MTTTSSNMISDIEPSTSDVDIDCTFSDLLESMEDDDESLSNVAAPLPTLLTPIQTPVHDQCSEESVFRLHPSSNPMLEEPLHPSRDTDRASTKTRVSVKEKKQKDSPKKKTMSSVVAKKENAKSSGEDEDASSRKKLKDACSGSESTRLQATGFIALIFQSSRFRSSPFRIERRRNDQLKRRRRRDGRRIIPRVRIDPHRMPTGDRKVVTVVMSTTRRTAHRHLVSDIPAGVTPELRMECTPPT